MLLGYDFIDDENAISDTTIHIGEIEKMSVKGAIYDEISVRSRTDIPFTTVKIEWTYDTLLLADFINNLNAGNVDFSNMTVAKLIVKRRLATEFEWQKLTEFLYEKGKIDFEYYDRTIEALEDYEYIVIPATADDTEGNIINIGSISPEFEGAFLMDKDLMFKLRAGLNYGSTARGIKNEVKEPFESQYPIVVSNGALNYDKGDLSAVVISDNTMKGIVIDTRQEKLHRKKIMDFLCNSKPKVLKDGIGNIWLIMIAGEPEVQYINEVRRRLASIAFNWVEVGDARNTETLRKNGLL